MKILIAVPDTGVGGVTTSAVNFSNELTSRGHEVHFLDMSGANACRDRLNEKVILCSLIGKSRLWNISANGLKSVKGLKKLAVLALGAVKKLTIRHGLWYKLIFGEFNKGESFDVAIAFRQCAPCYSFVLNKVNAKKKIGFVHGELTYMGDISSWKKFMTRFDKIAYVSNAVKEQFVKAYPELSANACTIYNTFDIEQIRALANESCDVKFDENKVNIVTVSRIENTQKQIQRIVSICREIKNKTAMPFHWYVVGDGPDYEEAVSLAKELGVEDVISFVGSRQNPYPYIRQCDFTALTSISEAYGMVVVESFVLNKPAVVSEYPAIYEIMENGKQGLIAEQSVESLTKCVKDMVDNKDGVREMFEKNILNSEINNEVAYMQFLESIK